MPTCLITSNSHLFTAKKTALSNGVQLKQLLLIIFRTFSLFLIVSDIMLKTLNYQFQKNANLSLLWQEPQFSIVIPFVLVSEELKCQCSLLLLHILWIKLFWRGGVHVWKCFGCRTTIRELHRDGKGSELFNMPRRRTSLSQIQMYWKAPHDEKEFSNLKQETWNVWTEREADLQRDHWQSTKLLGRGTE